MPRKVPCTARPPQISSRLKSRNPIVVGKQQSCGRSKRFSIMSLRTLFDFVASHPNSLPLHFEGLTPVEVKNVLDEAANRQALFAQMLRKRAAAMVSLPGRKSEAVREECAKAIAEFAPEEAH